MVLRERSKARRYRLGRRIAIGGMAEIYEGTTIGEADARKVAVKRLLANASNDGELEGMFVREAAVIAALDHPNVVEVIDVGQDKQELFLVMELVEGPSLEELLEALDKRKERLSIEVICGIVGQVARGLAHAHERALPDGSPLSIVHRDICGENVLITMDGIPKLVDFGLATISGLSMTQPGVVRGRARALAPEQARGQKVDSRADIFALGSLTFEMLSGKPLVDDWDDASVIARLQKGAIEPIAPRLDGVDPELIEIIERCTAPDPAMRMRSGRELERKLDHFRAARGMRIDSRALAKLVETVWPEVQELRAAKKRKKGDLEGVEVVLPAERDPSASSARTGSRASQAPAPRAPGRDVSPTEDGPTDPSVKAQQDPRGPPRKKRVERLPKLERPNLPRPPSLAKPEIEMRKRRYGWSEVVASFKSRPAFIWILLIGSLVLALLVAVISAMR